MNKIALCLVMTSTLIFTGCTPKAIDATLSKEATKEDMEAAIKRCPEAREEIRRCLNNDSSFLSRTNGHCTTPLTKKSVNYIVKDCIKPEKVKELARLAQLKEFNSITPESATSTP